MAMQILKQHRCFGGSLGFYRHDSQVCQTEMRFAVYQPPQAQTERSPILYLLSGLTCTEENFMVKAGAQRLAAEYGMVLVAPDTSPRQTQTPGEDESWDIGTGAGFYVDATVEPWSRHYQMYRYVVEELPALIAKNFAVDPQRQGICGHSMGGHGALVCALRNGDRYRSVSAFAPIVAPSQCPWGQKAFSQYLGADSSTWSAYDACELVKTASYGRTILIDQGAVDPFLEEQLQPHRFREACAAANQPLELRIHPGYDHSYFFIATFMADHLRHHAIALGQLSA
jgi:S-formylglutathione hydrolase